MAPAPGAGDLLHLSAIEKVPFKSQAQRRKFAELLVKGEISPQTFEEWNRETGRRRLPERETPKSAAKKTRARAGKTAKKR